MQEVTTTSSSQGPVSINICRPTLRGVAPDTPPEESWFPLWMLKRHFNFQVDDSPDFLFYGDVGNGEQFRYPTRTIRIFLTGENIPPNWKEADYALTHERLWNERHWRVPLWRHWYDPESTIPDRDFGAVRKRVDRFCNFIYSNDKATERIEFFEKLNQRKPVDSGGRVRNNLGGPVDDKIGRVRRSKFTIAFENESHPGYATEKIIEPLLHGSIPIYWGDPQIEEDFNPDCLINIHRFPDFDSAIEEVLRIDADDELWEKYVRAPIFANNRIPKKLADDAIVSFLRSIFYTRQPKISRSQRFLQKVRISAPPLVRRLRLMARGRMQSRIL